MQPAQPETVWTSDSEELELLKLALSSMGFDTSALLSYMKEEGAWLAKIRCLALTGLDEAKLAKDSYKEPEGWRQAFDNLRLKR